MIHVRVRVDRSPVHGLGVFALERVAVGTIVWTFTPGFDLDLDPRVLDTLPEHFRRRMLHYGYIDSTLDRFVLCCDDYRFINHSDSPNIRVERGALRHGVDVAARDIEAGEELTVDYESVEGRRPILE